jgi:D-lyxose ketol-isomerase
VSASAYPTASAALTAVFQNKTLTVTRDGQPLTSRCGLSPRSGSTRRETAADVERGEYRLTLPAGSDLVLAPGERVTVDGRRFKVVYAPAPSNLNLTDQYGVSSEPR